MPRGRARASATVVAGCRAARAALDAFNPDFILIFGDDQYENFREGGVPAFGVFALDEIDSRPYFRAGTNNAWSEPADTVTVETYIFNAPKAFAVFNPPHSGQSQPHA